MAQRRQESFGLDKGRTDGISCAGLLLIAMLVLVTLGIGFGKVISDRNRQQVEGAAAAFMPAVATPVQAGQVFSRIQPATEPTKQTGPAATTGAASSLELTIATGTVIPTPTSPPTETPAPAGETLPAIIPTDELRSDRPGDAPKAPPLPTPHQGYSWTLKVPILMYHYISVPPEGADKYRLDLSVYPETFRTHMQYLVDNGYTSIDMYDLSLAIVNKFELPEKPVIITLDDGYLDNYQNAFPILRELGMEATFFVATDFVDRGDPNYMNWAMIKEMAAVGMRIEPHSKTHPDLTTLDRDSIIWQVKGSQETIAAHTGSLPRYFAYPSGRYNEEVMDLMAELDFWGAVTTMGGRWHGFTDRYEWTRMRVHNRTAVAELADLLE